MTDQRSTMAPSTAPYPHRWRLIGFLGAAQLMLILDVTVVAVALPEMGADLGLRRDSLTWVMSAYTLAFGGLMLIGGRAADLFGPGRLVTAGLLLFTGASLVTGFASSAEVVIGGRATQGIGAALLSPAALSIVVRIFDGDERNRALGVWSALGGVGAAIGVLLGGLLTAGPGWSWIFWVNVPVGVVVAVALRRLLPALPGSASRSRLDVVGALLFTIATGTLTYAFIDAGQRGWGSARTLCSIAVSLVMYAVLAGWLREAKEPLVDPRLLVRRPVLAGTLVLFVATSLMVSVFFLGTFQLQEDEGHGPLATGLLFLPVALATMTGAHMGGRLVGKTGGRRLGVAALLLSAAGLVVPALVTGTIATVVAVAVAALGIGALFVVASATALGKVEPENAGVASGVLSTFHELGATLGAAVMSGVAAASLTTGSGAGFERAYLVAAALALAAAAVSALVLPAPEGPAMQALT